MNTYTRTVPAAEFSSFRRRILRTGGAIVTSWPCQDGTRAAGAFRVTYVAQAGV